MKLHIPLSVFVPYQILGGIALKRDDIPRFEWSKECLQYFQQHPEHSLRKEHIEFMKHTEKWAIDEYLIGMGTPHYRKDFV